jgi:hypothetical protein
MWLNLGLASGNTWVTSRTTVVFRDRELTLTAEDEDHLPSMFVEYGRTASEEINFALNLVREFLSDLCWATGEPMRENQHHESSAGGSPIKKFHSIEKRPELNLDFLIDPKESERRLALGLYREAMSASNVYQSFLNYFRIINITQKSGSALKRWLNDAVNELSNSPGALRVDTLKARGVENIGLHLFKQSKCASAHAGKEEPTSNPDHPSDELQMHEDVPLIQELAILMMHESLDLMTHEDARIAAALLNSKK